MASEMSEEYEATEEKKLPVISSFHGVEKLTILEQFNGSTIIFGA